MRELNGGAKVIKLKVHVLPDSMCLPTDMERAREQGTCPETCGLRRFEMHQFSWTRQQTLLRCSRPEMEVHYRDKAQLKMHETNRVPSSIAAAETCNILGLAYCRLRSHQLRPMKDAYVLANAGLMTGRFPHTHNCVLLSATPV